MNPRSEYPQVNHLIQVAGRLIDLSMPKVMGILNVTPDSFYENSRFTGEASILDHCRKMIEDGAQFIDIGGYSSRPGAEEITIQEELSRVIPAIQSVRRSFPESIISIDTFRSDVARQAIEAGADMVNDISGGELDLEMIDTVAGFNVPYILMHMRGTPQTMSKQTDYKNLLKEIIEFLHKKIYILHQRGIKDIIIDPGFGFAKSISQNFEMLNHLDLFRILGKPVLVGLSRKSMIWKPLGQSANEALPGTTSLHAIALSHGASILRVHDVKEAVECVRLHQLLSTNPSAK